MEVDLRSTSPSELDRIELKLMEFIRSGVEEENTFRARSSTKVIAETELVGNRPAGQTPETDRLVRIALEASKVVGFTPVLSYGSTQTSQ